MKKIYLYLDDVRTPLNDEWTVVRSYNAFVDHITLNGLENYGEISLDHDLGPLSIDQYYNNALPNYTIDYGKLGEEKTGFDCAKFLVSHYYSKFPNERNRSEEEKKTNGISFPTIYVHSANPIGSANIMGYINNFLRNERQPQTCVRVKIEHTRIDL
jgi:hypothetical protein